MIPTGDFREGACTLFKNGFYKFYAVKFQAVSATRDTRNIFGR